MVAFFSHNAGVFTDRPKDRPLKTIMAQRLRAARKAIYPVVTQREVAKRLGLSPSAVNLWEAGKTEPNAGHLLEMAKWFGVSTDWLLGFEGQRQARQSGRPVVHTVPVLPPAALVKWRWEAVSEVLQTMVAYPEHTAAAMVVSSDAMTSSAPTGCYAVVSRAHPTGPGAIVLAAVGRVGEPVLRKLVRDGREQLLVADDVRFPTFRLDDGARIIGRMTETVTRRQFF